MSHGVPVVGYALDGLPELVRHEQDGLLVPVANTEFLAKNIINLLRETEVANRMSESSFEHSVAEFQINICVRKHWDAFELLMKD